MLIKNTIIPMSNNFKIYKSILFKIKHKNNILTLSIKSIHGMHLFYVLGLIC